MMISKKVELGSWKPIRVARGGVGISHLIFVDNLLLFVEAKVSQIEISYASVEGF